MSALDLGLKAAVAVDGGLFGADLALDAAKQLSADTLGRGLRDSNEMETRRAAEMIRMDRLDQARRANLERLIRLKPDVYNMVAMGRKVPKGARVIGKIDEDALDRLAIQMSEGTVGS